MAVARSAKSISHTHRLASPISLFQPSAKGSSKIKTQHAVIVVFDLALEPLAAFEHQRLHRLDDRRPLVAHIAGGAVLQAWLLNRSGTNQLLQSVQANRLAHVELQQHQHGSAQNRFIGLQPMIRHRGLILPCRHDPAKGRERAVVPMVPRLVGSVARMKEPYFSTSASAMSRCLSSAAMPRSSSSFVTIRGGAITKWLTQAC